MIDSRYMSVKDHPGFITANRNVQDSLYLNACFLFNTLNATVFLLGYGRNSPFDVDIVIAQ